VSNDDTAGIELLVGRLGRAHGIRGDIIIDVRTDEPERRFAAGTVFATARGNLTLTQSRWHGQKLLATFEEASDRTAAEALRGLELRTTVPVDERPEDPDEYYDHQLIGLKVVDDHDVDLGVVEDVLHLPAQDMLVIRLIDAREGLIPLVAEMVPTVDLDRGLVVAVPPPGLLDAEDDQ
jgi:16S rRNA processing protein RimM